MLFSKGKLTWDLELTIVLKVKPNNLNSTTETIFQTSAFYAAGKQPEIT